MEALTPLSQYRAQIETCSVCGQCLPVCPVFARTGLERDGPRGRLLMVHALLRGQINPRETVISFTTCLLCGKCAQICPARIPLAAIFMAMREILAKYLSSSHGIRLFFRSLASYPRVWDFMQPPLFLLRKLTKRLKQGQDWRQISFQPFGITAESGPAAHAGSQRILLFSGCITRRVFPETARACVSALEGQGMKVLAPAELVCCGRPLALQGDISGLAKAVKRNLACLAKHDFEWLATPCPGCLNTIRNIWPSLGNRLAPKELNQAKDLARQCRDINQLLSGSAPMTGKMRIFWHRPCLMDQETEDSVLSRLGQCRSSDQASCCGAPLACLAPDRKKAQSADCEKPGGKPDLMTELARHIRSQAGGSDCIVTSCPGCMLALRKINALPVIHCIDLYRQSE